MPGLAEVVRGLAARDGVAAVVVVSPDGLPIDHAGRAADPEALAALAVTLLRPAVRLGDSAGLGALGRGVLEFAGGLAIVAAVARGHWLLVVADSDADIGTLLYDLRRDAPALAALF